MSMNSFNNITKIKYNKSQKDVVTLVEYIIFTDERNDEKYLVFKFQNNVNQFLNEIKFEISQFDQDNNLLSKSIISHGAFVAKENEVFVPNYKLKADSDCVKIEAKLLLARYERVVWENGTYTPIPYTASEFRNDYYRPVPTKPAKNKKIVKAEQKIEYKQFKKLQKQFKKKKNIVTKNIIKRNKTKFPTAFVTILSILLLAAVGVFTYLNSKSSNVYFDGGFDYTVNGNSVIITDYEGSNTNVILPTTYKVGNNEYEVVGIGEGAFKNTKIKSIEFTKEVRIAANAFENCKDLELILGQDKIVAIGINAFKNCSSLFSVSLSHKDLKVVPQGAFAGCTSLITASFKNAMIHHGAFEDCKNLEVLDCNSIFGDAKLADIFSDEENIANYKLKVIKIAQAVIPANFTEGYSQLSKVVLTGINQKATYGAFAGSPNIEGYVNNGSVEIINGQIVSVKDKTNIVIPNASNLNIEDTFEYLYDFASTIQSLSIEYAGNTTITKEHLAKFTNLKSISFAKNTKVEHDVLEGKNIILLGLSLDSKYEFAIPSTVTAYTIFDTNILSESAMNKLINLSSITSLTIEDSVKSFAGNPLIGFTNLLSLTTPNLFVGDNIDLYNNFGASYSLTTLNITGSTNVINLTIDNYPHLNKIDLSNSKIITSKLSVTNCNNLREITLPNELISIEKTLVANTPSLTKLVIPTTVTKCTYPLVGKGCNLLVQLEVPFVGKNVMDTTSYQVFNESYEATKDLTITSEITGKTDKMFENCNFNKLVVSMTNITDETFKNSTISELHIIKTSSITTMSLLNINNLKVLYLPSTEVAAMLDYEKLFSTMQITIYLDGDLPENAQAYSKYFKKSNVA